MALYPVTFNNFSGGILGVKSESWLELLLNGVQFNGSDQFAQLVIIIDAMPNLGEYFELQFQGLTLRFTFVPAQQFEKQIIKTDYGYNISVLHPQNTIEGALQSLASTLSATPMLSEHYALNVGAQLTLTARKPGAQWYFNQELFDNNPYLNTFSFTQNPYAPFAAPPENLMLSLKAGVEPNKYDFNGTPIPTLYSRAQLHRLGYYTFYFRLDQVCMPELKFHSPENTGSIAPSSNLFEVITGMIKLIRLQGAEVSGQPAVSKQTYFAPSDAYIIRSGISSETVKALGPNWFESIVMNQRSGVLSYYDHRVIVGYQKFLYLVVNQDGSFVNLRAIANIIQLDGSIQQVGPITITGKLVETAPELVSFNIGDSFANRLRTQIAVAINQVDDWILQEYQLYLTDGSNNLLRDLGTFECVPETFNSKTFYYENDFGGLSDAIFTGASSSLIEVSKTDYHKLGFNSVIRDHQTNQHTSSIDILQEANSGALSKERFLEVLEILNSEHVWERNSNGELIPISIEPGTFIIYKDNLDGEFVFALSIKYSGAYVTNAIAAKDNF